MVYKNFLLRILLSLFFFFTYLFICLVEFNLIFYFICFIYLFIFFEIYYYFRQYKFIPLFYVLISFLFFLLTINFDEKNFIFFNFYIFIVITFDTFSYLAGKSFGTKQLIKISPNKTFEGLIGGILFSIIFSSLFSYYFNITISVITFFFIVLIIFSAFIGDITESYFKRKNNLKNSSEFIPGHGGVFDRFDSFLFSIFFYSIFINIIE
tara:strand:+ start:137 stop:763 length:627 start_codon:yes stop_codon:yes gene_type:complete